MDMQIVGRTAHLSECFVCGIPAINGYTPTVNGQAVGAEVRACSRHSLDAWQRAEQQAKDYIAGKTPRVYYIGGEVAYTEQATPEFQVAKIMKITHKASGQVTFKAFYTATAEDFDRALALLSNGPTGECWTWEAAQ